MKRSIGAILLLAAVLAAYMEKEPGSFSQDRAADGQMEARGLRGR